MDVTHSQLTPHEVMTTGKRNLCFPHAFDLCCCLTGSDLNHSDERTTYWSITESPLVRRRLLDIPWRVWMLENHGSFGYAFDPLPSGRNLVSHGIHENDPTESYLIALIR